MEIPKVIHQFWIGDEMPLSYRCFAQHLQDLHPDWEYVLWNEQTMPPLRHQYICDYFYENGFLNAHSLTSDLVRHEILMREGGVWIDTDMLILKNLEPLLENEELVVAKQMRGSHHMSMNSCFFAITEWHHLHDIIETVIDSRFKEMSQKTYKLEPDDSERDRYKKLWNTHLNSVGPGMTTAAIHACIPKYQPPPIGTFHPFSMGEVIERQLEPTDAYGIHFFNSKNHPDSIEIHKHLDCYEWVVNGGS